MVAQSSLLHVRYDGHSVDIPLTDLDISQNTNDEQVKRATARYLDISERELQLYVVDRHATENMTIRPQAIFG